MHHIHNYLLLKLIAKLTTSCLLIRHQKFWHEYQVGTHARCSSTATWAQHYARSWHRSPDYGRIGFSSWIRWSSGLLSHNLLLLTRPSKSRMNSSVICQKPTIPFQIKITCHHSLLRTYDLAFLTRTWFFILLENVAFPFTLWMPKLISVLSCWELSFHFSLISLASGNEVSPSTSG